LSRPDSAFPPKKQRTTPLLQHFLATKHGYELMHFPRLVYPSCVMAELECLMLAAGRSARMGDWKMMLSWGGSTIVEHSVRTALKVCARVVLVSGFRAEQLIEVFEDWPRVEVVRNHNYEAGMFSSVQRGAQAVEERDFFLALADMPGVTETIYGQLLVWSGRLSSVFDSTGEAYAVIPQYRGKKGHPLLLSARMRARILQADVSKTLRDVLAEVPTMIVPVDEQGIVHDIDTPQDYHSGSQ
jgi:molybdenum cofactor cytidylyltransferase